LLVFENFVDWYRCISRSSTCSFQDGDLGERQVCWVTAGCNCISPGRKPSTVWPQATSGKVLLVGLCL